MRADLLDPVEWKRISDDIDSKFGNGVAKALLGDRQPIALTDGETRRLYLVTSEWIEHLVGEETADSGAFDLRFLGKELGSIIKGHLRLSLQVLPDLVHLTNNILEVSGQAGESFTYGRSILKEGVVSLQPGLERRKQVLIVNKDRECLGIASLAVDADKVDKLAPEKLVAKNLADVGWFIRRLG